MNLVFLKWLRSTLTLANALTSVVALGLAVFFIGCFTVVCAQAYPTASSKSLLQQHYDDAQKFQASGDLPQAARQYRIFIADALGELAIEHARIEDYEKAAPLFDEALSLAPNSPVLQIDYAQAAFVHGDLSRAKSLTEQVIRSYPTNAKASARAHLILGRVLLKTNNVEEARKHLETAVALEPNFENGYALAVACLDMEDGKCAARIFSEMVTSFGDTAVIHREFGRAYGGSDFQQEAIAELQKSIAKDDRLPGVHYTLAAVYLSSSEGAKTQEAEQELRKELEVSPNDFLTYAALGHLEAGQHNYAEAERNLTHAAALNPNSPDVFFYLGQICLETNRTAEAEAALRKSIHLTKDVSHNRYQVQKAHYLLGRLLAQSGHADEARTEMQASAALTNRSLVQDRNRLADYLQQPVESGMGSGDALAPRPAAAQPGDAETAKAAQQIDGFEKQLSPAIADSYNNLGAIAAGGKDFPTALTYFQRAAEWNPSLEGLDYNWGRAAFSSGNFQGALLPLNRALQAHPEDESVRSMFGTSQFMTRDYAGALKTLQPMESRMDTMHPLMFIYAASMVKTGDVDHGIAILTALEKEDPNIADVHRALGEAFAVRGDKPKAADELRTAIRLNASDAEAYFALGKLNREQGKLNEAIANLEVAARLTPSDDAVHWELAAAYTQASRSADALREQKQYESLRAAHTATDAPGKPN